VPAKIGADPCVTVAGQIDQPPVVVEPEQHELLGAPGRSACACQRLLPAQPVDQAGLATIRAPGHRDLDAGVGRHLGAMVHTIDVGGRMEQFLDLTHGMSS